MRIVVRCCVGLLLTGLVTAVVAKAPYRPALAIEEFTLLVEDLPAAERFYKELLGLREVARETGSVTLESSLGSAIRIAATTAAPGQTSLRLKTDSLAAVGVALRKRGVASSLARGANGMQLTVEDPFGNRLTISEGFPPPLAVPFYRISASGIGTELGEIRFHFGPFGTVLVPNLQGLPPGRHSVHIHEFGDCGSAANAENMVVAGLAAGGHYQPEDFAWMGSPVGEGTLGDLPDLYAESDGRILGAVVAAEVRRDDLRGRAVMIHARSDDSVTVTSGTDRPSTMDHAAHMMGPNPRMACGVAPD